MLPTFVIGLREGVEAALIVAIIAGFLRQEGRARRPALDLARGRRRCRDLRRRRRRARAPRPGAAPAPAGGAGDGRRLRRWGSSPSCSSGCAGTRAASRPAARRAPPRRWRPARGGAGRRWRSSPSSARGWRPPSSCSPSSRTRTTRDAGLGAMLGLVCAVAIGDAMYRGGSGSTSAGSSASPASCSCSSPPGWSPARCTPPTRRAGSTPARGRRSTSAGSWFRARGPPRCSPGCSASQPQPTRRRGHRLLSTSFPPSLRAVARRGAGRAPGAHREARRRCALVAPSASPRAVGGGDRAGCGAKQVAVKLTDAGCAPANSSSAPAADLQGDQRRHRPRQRARGPEGLRILARRRTSSPASPAPSRSPCRRARYRSTAPEVTTEAAGWSPSAMPPPAATGPRPQAAVDRLQVSMCRRQARAAGERDSGSSWPRSRRATPPKAKRQFGAARVHYETIEPVAESFGTLDPEIDARINDV